MLIKTLFMQDIYISLCCVQSVPNTPFQSKDLYISKEDRKGWSLCQRWIIAGFYLYSGYSRRESRRQLGKYFCYQLLMSQLFSRLHYSDYSCLRVGGGNGRSKVKGLHEGGGGEGNGRSKVKGLHEGGEGEVKGQGIA